jgi:hypothetical protein
MITLTAILTLVSCLLAGLFDGLAETLKWHSGSFTKRFPK